MNRRQFSGAALIVTVLGAAGLRYGMSRDQDGIIATIRKRLSYLRLDDSGLRRFADDLAATHKISSIRLRVLGAAAPLYQRLEPRDWMTVGLSVRHSEDHVTTQYLLSSDFFINGADENRLVLYLGLYDAMRPCTNPFARPVASPSDA
jgi:hypothetical protein